jgi:transposase
MKSPMFIGVDVSKATLDCAVYGQAQVTTIANSVGAIRRWLGSLPTRCLIGVESTGKLHWLLVREAIAAGHTPYVFNARDLSHYARALGRRAKTDRLDAHLIARYLAHEHQNLHPYQLPTQLQTQLGELIRRRHQVVVSRDALRQGIAQMSCKLRSLKKLERAFDQAIAEIDERLQRLVAQDPTLAAHASRLQTVVGFGPLLSGALAHTITSRPFKNSDAFVAFVGYDPRVRESGQFQGKGSLSKRGPAEVRRLLFTAAMAASRSKLWRPFYERYRARGFSTTAALAILARKLARVAFSIVRYGTEFQPERILTACAKP